jgi:hypothetical protein
MPLFSICLNYITIIMLTSTPWLLFIIYIYIILLLVYFGQADPMLLMTMDFFSFFKETTTSFKLIYKHHG